MTGLSQTKAAALVGVEGRTLRRWGADDRAIPYSAWVLLVEVAGMGAMWK